MQDLAPVHVLQGHADLQEVVHDLVLGQWPREAFDQRP